MLEFEQEEGEQQEVSDCPFPPPPPYPPFAVNVAPFACGFPEGFCLNLSLDFVFSFNPRCCELLQRVVIRTFTEYHPLAPAFPHPLPPFTPCLVPEVPAVPPGNKDAS